MEGAFRARTITGMMMRTTMPRMYHVLRRLREEVVRGRRDHGRLDRVKGRRRDRENHDEHDADDPRGQLTQQQEEGHRGRHVLGRVARVGARPHGDGPRHADECQDHEDRHYRDRDARPEVPVRLGRKGTEPKVR